MDENMIHRYLAESPFFDHTTNNGLHFSQARTNQGEFDLVKDRRRLEDTLTRQIGSEYMIVGEPREVSGGQKSGVWNIRKQDRSWDGLTTLGSYYIVGENLYQAPSVGDIVGNRLCSAATSLAKFFDTASSLATYSPTSGYTYLPNTTRSSATAGGTSSQGTPTHSREGSLVPGDAQSLRSASLAPAESNLGSNAANTAAQDARILAQSFRMALEFHDEYMDENPILGEPGHFSFTSSLAAVKKRKAADEEAAALAAKAKELKSATATGTAVKTEKAADPPAVMTEAKALQAKEKERRGSKMGDRMRRKKSRANAGSLAGLPESSSS